MKTSQKSIVLLPEDLFFLSLGQQGISTDLINPCTFTDIPGVSFLSVAIPHSFLESEVASPYKDWPDSSRTYANRSVADFVKRNSKKKPVFPFMMFASKNGTTICSLHISDIPRLRTDARPPFVVTVNTGKRTKTDFIRPFIEYREYVVHPAIRGIVSSFYSNYQTLMHSGAYHHEIIDTQVEDIFSDIGKPKEKNIILKTLPH